jgi:predicted acetyltransferase
MREVRKLTAADLDDLVTITTHAYPGMQLFSAQDRERYKRRLLRMDQDPDLTLYGLFEGGQLRGGMGLHDFTLQMHGARVGAGGLDMVAVDLMHKKEKVARDMTAFFLEHCRQKGHILAMLYPFRPDFYRRMGFGYGPKINRYRVRPADLPRGPSKAHVQMLSEADKPALLAFYNRYAAETHGMIQRNTFEQDRLFDRPETRYAGYKKDGAVQGYLQFGFRRGKEDNWLVNDLEVREFICASREALAELLTFLHTQLDQIRYVVFHLHDDHFHYLFHDPRNDTDNIMWPVHQECNVQGIGLMYRVVDVPGAFEALRGHDFGGQSCRLELIVRDSLLPENDGSLVIHFEDGAAQVRNGGGADVAIALEIAGFSSLLMGVIDFARLCRYGLAEISDPAYLGTVDALFRTWEKPVCTTIF